MRRKASSGNLESMAISLSSRRKMTASAISPLTNLYCMSNCERGRESSSNRCRVTSPRRPRVFAPPRTCSRDCVACERPRLCSWTSPICLWIRPICSRVFLSSVAMAVWPCEAICAELVTPSRRALVTLSRRWATVCADGLDLTGALRLRRADGLKIAAEIGQLFFEDVAFFLAAGGLQWRAR